MAVYLVKVRITNSKYTLPIPPFEVTASSWPVAMHRAAERAIRQYKVTRGRRDRPLEVEVQASQRSTGTDHHIVDTEDVNGLR